MTTVYVLIRDGGPSGGPTSEEVVGVFSSRDKAKEQVQPWWYDYHLDEFVIDAPVGQP